MKIREHIALTTAGLAFIGGAVLVGGAANATTSVGHENVRIASSVTPDNELTAAIAKPWRPRCRSHVPGHYVTRHKHGRIVRVWIAGHWLPRGCTHHR